MGTDAHFVTLCSATLSEIAVQECSERIDLYQHFEESLSMLIPSLYFFNHEGQPNDRQIVKDN